MRRIFRACVHGSPESSAIAVHAGNAGSGWVSRGRGRRYSSALTPTLSRRAGEGAETSPFLHDSIPPRGKTWRSAMPEEQVIADHAWLAFGFSVLYIIQIRSCLSKKPCAARGNHACACTGKLSLASRIAGFCTGAVVVQCHAGRGKPIPDEPLRMYRDNQRNRIGRYDEYGRRYLVDVTMKF